MNYLASLLLTILLASCPVICLSAELYHWVDESGAHHITDSPPDNSTEVIMRIKYKDRTPEEIQRDAEEEKAKQTQIAKEADLKRKQDELEAAKEKERQHKQALQDAVRLQATEDLRSMEGNLEFYQRTPRPSQEKVNQNGYEKQVKERKLGESAQDKQP
jgi:hypothetical protein